MKSNDYNTLQYMEHVNENADFRITIKDFCEWLDEHDEAETLYNHFCYLNRVKDNQEADEYLHMIACDYSIPIIMIKYLRMQWWCL